MASSTTNLDTISVSQAGKETTANEMFDALSPASLFGRRASTCAGLTWGYYGGPIMVDGVATAIANGTVALTTAATNYIEATRAGVVSANTTAFTAGRVPLYTAVAGASTVTSYTDHRPWAALPGVTSRLSKSVAGSSNVTLTAAEARVDAIALTGALTGSIDVIVPNGPQAWIVTNGTTGSFAVTVKTSAGTGVVVVQGLSAVLLADGTNVVSAASSGAGLANFTEAIATTGANSPNSAASLTPNSVASITDIVLLPKSTGSILAAIPDNTSTGGNKRGLRATDLQMNRSAATQVAQANDTAIVGGRRNKVQATYGAIVGGDENDSVGQAAFIGGGTLNTASGTNSAAFGNGNVAGGASSIAVGKESSTLGLNAARSLSSGKYSAVGDTELIEQCQAALTTNNTARQMVADIASLTTYNVVNQFVLPNSSAMAVVGEVSARQASTGDCAAWKFEFLVKRGASAATVALVGAGAVTSLGADAGAAAWTVTLGVDTTNGSPKIIVTGENSKTILWSANLRGTLVTG